MYILNRTDCESGHTCTSDHNGTQTHLLRAAEPVVSVPEVEEESPVLSALLSAVDASL